MGTSSTNSSVNIPSKCNLDGTEIYGLDGQTVVDITDLTTEEIENILEIKKDFPKEAK